MCTEQIISEQLCIFDLGESKKPARTKRYPNCGLWYYCECGDLVGLHHHDKMILKLKYCETCKLRIDWSEV